MSSLLRFPRSYIHVLALSSAIAILGGGCQLLSPLSGSTQSTSELDSPSAVASAEIESPEELATTSASSNEAVASSTSSPNTDNPAASGSAATTPPADDPFPDAINQASSAFSLSQAAQSRDDWRLVANRWQQAIAAMTAVPASSPNHGQAQQKLTEYRRNFTYAQQQAATPLPEPAPGRIVEVPVASSSPTPAPSRPAATPRPPQPEPRTARTTPPAAEGRVYLAPIVRRSGGTPVVSVTFNGRQRFDMIVDTGASGTVITQPMARALGIAPVGETRVATASANNVTFQLGYVNSMEVGGSQRGRMRVAIAGPSLDIGLLGHDFFGGYDITVRQDVVEFRER